MWLLITCAYGSPSPPFRLARVVTSGMVLQAEHPAIFGWATPGANVVVTTSDGETTAAVDANKTSGSWRVVMKPRVAKVASAGISLTVTSSRDSASLTIHDVLYGDVWVCSGQSNMEFSVAEAYEANAIIGGAELDGLRLFAVQKNASSVELDDLVDVQTDSGGWVHSTPATVCGAEYNNDGYAKNNTFPYCGPHCGPSASVKSFSRATWGYFSAACWLHGRALLRETGRPQGMLESCWGGTRIESWSSNSALRACGGSPDPSSEAMGGNHWGGMITPLLKLPIKGVVWYQGEANSGSESAANLYYCEMASMIADWRARWALADAATTRPSTMDPDFPFIIAQLAPEGGPSAMVTRYSMWGTAAATFTGTGPAESAGAGSSSVASIPTLRKVGLANLIDLYDAGSPCGAVHIRNKTVVG